MANEELWQIQTYILDVLAFSFRYPGDETASAVMTGQWKAAVEDAFDALETELPEGFAECDVTLNAKGEAAGDAEELKHSLRAEATRLFIGAPNAAVSPYEGVWRAKDDGVQPLLFVNPHSMAVERFLKSCGLGQPEGKNDPLDHAATELEFLQYLAALASGLDAPIEGAKAADQLPGGSPETAFETFMGEHVKTWMPRFAESVETETRLPYYRVAAQLLKAFLANM